MIFNFTLRLRAQECFEIVDQSFEYISLKYNDSLAKVEIKLSDAGEYNNMADFSNKGNNIYSIPHLTPATIYDLRLYNRVGLSCKKRFVTQSNSSGIIKNYFNHEVSDAEIQEPLTPNGTTFNGVEKAIITLIRNAKKSIEYAVYNTSVASIVNELIDASNRGVFVRVITESENSNTAFNTALPFQILKDRNSDYMHNKFIIVDADDVQATVVTGSMNLTTNQMKVDPNHLIFIEDQSLARSYRLEFNEMWGGSEATPNLSNSKFGLYKTDNTPHEFNVNGIKMKSYFSPSDQTSTFIQQEILNTDYTLNAGLLLLTDNNIKTNLIELAHQGKNVSLIIDDEWFNSPNVQELKAYGISALSDNSSTIFHYKLAAIDVNKFDANPTVITGSHNWSYAADTRNDENTLIIYDTKLTDLYNRALIYFREKLTTVINEKDNNHSDFYLYNFDDGVALKILDSHFIDQFTFFDVMGRKLNSSFNQIDKNTYIINHLPNGIYFCKHTDPYNDKFSTKKTMKL